MIRIQVCRIHQKTVVYPRQSKLTMQYVVHGVSYRVIRRKLLIMCLIFKLR
jgi:hypothetical protein